VAFAPSAQLRPLLDQLPLRRLRIVAVGVLLADQPIVALDDDLDTAPRGDRRRDRDSRGLRVVQTCSTRRALGHDAVAVGAVAGDPHVLSAHGRLATSMASALIAGSSRSATIVSGDGDEMIPP